MCAFIAQCHYINGKNATLLVWQPTGINIFSTVMLTLAMILLTSKQINQKYFCWSPA